MSEADRPSSTRSTAPWSGPRSAVVAIAALGLVASGAARPEAGSVSVGPPVPVDSLTTLPEIARRVDACAAEGCAGAVYLWSPRMPLSREGIAEAAAAAGRVGLSLTVATTEALDRYGADPSAAPIAVADRMLAAGALAHGPALLIHRDGGFVGNAILGYKTAAAWERLIRDRLAEPAAPARRTTAPPGEPASTPITPESRFTDYAAIGNPGAYFRWVPGRATVAYESRRTVYLLDLRDGGNRPGAGYIDFVPTPDGRYFVTPGEGRAGLEFYDADEVFRAARSNGRTRATPIFNDQAMADQYPSVGILETSADRTVYRVLTSWFTGIAYRDYAVHHDARGRPDRVRPIGPPVKPCANRSLSIPIMAQDGFEVAARDESSGTTRIYRMLDGGRCTEVEDLGIQTSKVAWHRSGRLLAFGRPQLRSGASGRGEAAIHLHDRDGGGTTRVPGTEGASTLAFPDFVGDDALVFLIPSRRGQRSVFRVVEGIR